MGINNLTNNLALKATIFAKLSNKYYISQKIFTIKSQEHTSVRLQDENFLIEKFEMIYTQELLANPAFKDYFINSISNGDNKFYVVYVDIEGNVHGTSLACEYLTLMDGKVQILPPAPELFESMRMDIPYCAGEQSFLIGESAIQHGTGIAIASLRRLSE